jgi:hypothetical protein
MIVFAFCGADSDEDVVYKMVNEMAYFKSMGIEDPQTMSEHFTSIFEDNEEAQTIICQIQKQGGEYKENLIENAIVRRTRKENLTADEIERLIKQLSLAIYYTAQEFCIGISPDRS